MKKPDDSIDNVFLQRCRDSRCRSCSHDGLLPVLDLGMMPASDRLLRSSELSRPEQTFPLEFAYCPDCSLLQIIETVDPSFLFGEDYLYFSSFSPQLLDHAKNNALDLMDRLKLGSASHVMEIASNDGYLLKNFVDQGIPVLGIDPAPKQAQAALMAKVPTLNAFFSSELAQTLADEGRHADLIIANNVLAHVADIHGFVEGIRILLKDDGLAVIEVPYAKDLIDGLEFDTIYHEHLCYFSLTSLDRLLREHKLYVQDFRRLEIHGGSVRVYVSKDDNPSDALRKQLVEETMGGIASYEYVKDFALEVEKSRKLLTEMIRDLKSKGFRIAAYGAAAKGSILLNYNELGVSEIDYVVDRNVHKHGRHMPGSKLEIMPVNKLLDDLPDFTLLLPWNFCEEILTQQREYLEKGGRFIVPVPKPEILST